MAYLTDIDLEFLQYCSDESLELLHDILLYDGDDGERFTCFMDSEEEYKLHHPKHSKYWKLLGEEIQRFGGNSFANMFRDHGVFYKEVLTDVCDKIGLNYNKNSEVDTIEKYLLMKILEESIEKMTVEQRKELMKTLDIKTDGFTSNAIILAFQTIFKMGGFKSYQITSVVVNATLKILIGRGLPLAGNAMLMKTMSILTGPIGLAATGLWTAIDIAGPAYRVTTPSVLMVALLRQERLCDKSLHEEV